ncbi:MAG: type II secretion system protein [Candidatus Staskawiczbacteria bacterium]|nr:type II secretion system protein [Candidatus Staskawiczbacteria bacterium]
MYSKGFTIIELLIVVAIIIVLPAVVISNFPQIKNQFALSRAVYQLSQDIRMAQNMSLSSVPYKDSFSLLRSVAGYGVHIDINALGNKKYILYADNSDSGVGNQQYDNLDYIVSVIDFRNSEQGVVIKEISNVVGNRASVNFSSLDGDVSIGEIDEGKSDINVVLTLESDPAKTRSVLINTSGLIEVK